MSVALWTSLWCCCVTGAHASVAPGEASIAQVEQPAGGCGTGGCSKSQSQASDPQSRESDKKHSEDCGCDGDADRGHSAMELPSVAKAPLAAMLSLVDLPADVGAAHVAQRRQDDLRFIPPSLSLFSLHCLLTT